MALRSSAKCLLTSNLLTWGQCHYFSTGLSRSCIKNSYQAYKRTLLLLPHHPPGGLSFQSSPARSFNNDYFLWNSAARPWIFPFRLYTQLVKPGDTAHVQPTGQIDGKSKNDGSSVDSQRDIKTHPIAFHASGVQLSELRDEDQTMDKDDAIYMHGINESLLHAAQDVSNEIFRDVRPDANTTQMLKAEFENARLAMKRASQKLHDVPKMNPYAVYANHNLRLDRIRVYGFDFDYTIASYTPALHQLIYNLAKEHLVKELRYPETCLAFEYDHTFPIRGLYYDKKQGFLLKLDFFHTLELGACYFGRRKVSHEELDAVYGGSHISMDHMPNLAAILDLFALSETCLISDVIQHFVDQNLEFDPSYVYEDVKRCIEHVHRSQSMHREILLYPARYLHRNESVVKMLGKLKQGGKKLFMLTNSPFPFVDGGMRYLFQEDGRNGETWRQYFDVVIALADKPNFYSSTRPFRFYNILKDNLTFRKVAKFESDGVYYHGNLKEFLSITGWKGSEVLYFGDQVYSDLRGPQRAGWRTAAIIHELETDIITSNAPEYRFQQAKYHVIQELLGKFHDQEESTHGPAEHALLAALERANQEARTTMRNMFNSYFGSPFLTSAGKESAFAYNVQRYADVYTSRLENFMEYSSQAWLYTPYSVKILPHHVKVGPSQVLAEATSTNIAGST